MKTGVVILFHGSRVKGSDDVAHRIISDIRRHGVYSIIEPAFLQHKEPGLMTSIQKCVQHHVERIVIVPFFLQLGMHVTADIPVLVEAARKHYPGLTIDVTDAVGSHPLMTEIVIDLVGKSAQYP